jgi:hypothetical protein
MQDGFIREENNSSGYYPNMQYGFIREENNSSNFKFIIVFFCILGLLYIIFFKDSGNTSSSNTGSSNTGSSNTSSSNTGSSNTGSSNTGSSNTSSSNTSSSNTGSSNTSSSNTGSSNVSQDRFEVLSTKWYSKPFQSITKDMETCQARWGENNCEIIPYGLSKAAIHKCQLQAKEKGITDITNWKGIARAGNGLKNPYCVNQIKALYPEYELDPTASDTPQTYKDWYNKPKFYLTSFDSKSTEFTPLGVGENYYLDRHNLTCKTKSGINKFQYILGDQTKDDTKNTFQYKYTCTNGGELEDTLITKTTTANDDGGGNYYHLDRHDVACGSDEILNQFVLKRPETGKINYSYNCIKSKKPLTCRKVETTKVNNVDGDNTKNLKNHNISCADDEVLQSFLLTRGTPNTLVGYDYTCCKY